MRVSVCVVTYNHEQFLGEALDSIIQQELDYPIEIEIGEDRSTDKTLKICQEYKGKYPHIVNLHVNETNLGYNWNFYRTLERCNGDFIAVLDGDDFWTDINKLKKQVEFLEENPEYSLCFSKYYVSNENSELIDITGFSGHFKLNDVLNGKCPGTRTVVFRKEFFPSTLPKEFDDISYADHILFALIAQLGPIFGFDEPLAAYRMNSKSLYASKSMETRSLNIIRNYELMKKVFPEKEKMKAIETGIVNERVRLERHYFYTYQIFKLYRNSIKIIAFDMSNLKINFLKSWINILKVMMKIVIGKMTLEQARL